MAFQHKRNVDAPELFRPRRLDYTDRTKRSNVFHHIARLCHQIGRPWFLTLAFGEAWDQVKFLCVLSGATWPRASARVQETFAGFKFFL